MGNSNRYDRVREDAIVQTGMRFRLPRTLSMGKKKRGGGTVCEVPMVVLTMHLGPVLTPRELFAFCTAHSSLWYNSAGFVSFLAAAQHGTESNAVTDFGQLRKLEKTPRLYVLDFTSPKFLRESGVRLLRGSRLAHPIFVGSTEKSITTAVNPPAQGDAWEVSAPLQKGFYRVSVAGWRNPYHGILDITMDDERVTDNGGLDWYSDETAERHAFPGFAEVEIKRTGMHVWRFETNRRHSQSQRHWMCLAEFCVECVGPVETIAHGTLADEARRGRTLSRWRAVACQTLAAMRSRWPSARMPHIRGARPWNFNRWLRGYNLQGQ